MIYRNWTDEEITQLRRSHALGLSVQEAAKALGRGVESTRSKGKAIGVFFENAHRLGRVAVSRDADVAKFIKLPPARYSSRSAMILGDPPIGRSALDRRSGAGASRQ